MPWRLLAALLSLLLPTVATAISYTVQVVAVSEQESALAVQRTLLNDAYPAYVVRASTVHGDIYRVRVGAFGNREAALLFANSMPVVAGSPPLPALAEGIPAAVMPLEPRVRERVEEDVLELLPWGEGLAVRVQPDPGAPADYRILSAERRWSFEAWRAEPVEGGVLRLRNLPLWPETWEEDVPEAREAYRLAALGSLAQRFEVSLAELEELQANPSFGPPYLVILELIAPNANDDEQALLAIAQPEGGRYGPAELAVGSGELPQILEPLYRASPGSAPVAEEFSGVDWTASTAGEFFLLQTEDGTRGWRAGVGMPLWSDGRYLLTRSGGQLIVYDFVRR